MNTSQAMVRSTNYSYYNDPIYSTTAYSRPIQIYYIVSGIMAAFGNMYLIILFFTFSKLRAVQCNWLITFLCISDVLIGIGTFARGMINMIAMDRSIIYFNFYFCTLSTVPFSCGYRIAQTIALILAFDRFYSIWRPAAYAKRQGKSYIVVISAIITAIVFSLIVFIFVYGVDFSKPLLLSQCVNPNGIYWSKVMPSYSGIISIIFFATYVTSLTLFSRHITYTKNQQTQLHKQMSIVHMKIFISISIVLLCYSIFYVIPTISQMFKTYFGLSGPFFDILGYFIIYGAELNGCLNFVIYLIKHQEFKECSKIVIFRMVGMQTNVGASSKVITVKTLQTKNIV